MFKFEPKIVPYKTIREFYVDYIVNGKVPHDALVNITVFEQIRRNYKDQNIFRELSIQKVYTNYYVYLEDLFEVMRRGEPLSYKRNSWYGKVMVEIKASLYKDVLSELYKQGYVISNLCVATFGPSSHTTKPVDKRLKHNIYDALELFEYYKRIRERSSKQSLRWDTRFLDGLPPADRDYTRYASLKKMIKYPKEILNTSYTYTGKMYIDGPILFYNIATNPEHYREIRRVRKERLENLIDKYLSYSSKIE